MEQDANTQAGITEWGIAAMTGGSAWRYERVGCGCVRLELLSLSLSLALALYVTGRPHMEPDGPRSRKRLKGVSQWRRACVARAGRVRGRTREHAASSRQESRMTTRTPDICHDF